MIQLNPKDFESEFKVLYTQPDLATEVQKLNDLFTGVETAEFSAGTLKKKIDLQRGLEFLLDSELNQYYLQTGNVRNMSILGKLVEEMKLESDSTNQKKMKLEVLNLDRYMKLDHVALQALQIFPKSQQKKVIASNETLFDLLCKCKTSIGTRCLKRWMKQPLQDRE